MNVCIDGAYSQLKKIVIKHKSHDQSNLSVPGIWEKLSLTGLLGQ